MVTRRQPTLPFYDTERAENQDQPRGSLPSARPASRPASPAPARPGHGPVPVTSQPTPVSPPVTDQPASAPVGSSAPAPRPVTPQPTSSQAQPSVMATAIGKLELATEQQKQAIRNAKWQPSAGRTTNTLKNAYKVYTYRSPDLNRLPKGDAAASDFIKRLKYSAAQLAPHIQKQVNYKYTFEPESVSLSAQAYVAN
jgi:hypothetical protein